MILDSEIDTKERHDMKRRQTRTIVLKYSEVEAYARNCKTLFGVPLDGPLVENLNAAKELHSEAIRARVSAHNTHGRQSAEWRAANARTIETQKLVDDANRALFATSTLKK